MRLRAATLVACIFLVAACSKAPGDTAASPAGAAASAHTASIAALPATLEGDLAISESNDWGYFGDLTVSGIAYPVAIPASLFEGSGVANEGGKVRLTLASKQGEGSSFQYVASSITKL